MPRRILVLLAHPAHRRSRANAALRRAAGEVEGATLHDLYETYPDFLRRCCINQVEDGLFPSAL